MFDPIRTGHAAEHDVKTALNEPAGRAFEIIADPNEGNESVCRLSQCNRFRVQRAQVLRQESSSVRSVSRWIEKLFWHRAG